MLIERESDSGRAYRIGHVRYAGRETVYRQRSSGESRLCCGKYSEKPAKGREQRVLDNGEGSKYRRDITSFIQVMVD